MQKSITAFLLFSRYSNWRFISSTVLCRRSSNHGDNFLAQFLHRFPSSNFRFPSKPIFSPQISQIFLSNNPIAFLSFLPHQNHAVLVRQYFTLFYNIYFVKICLYGEVLSICFRSFFFTAIRLWFKTQFSII